MFIAVDNVDKVEKNEVKAVIIEKNIVKAQFINRPNRFRAHVYKDEEELIVHVPNTGRCREILIPGASIILREESNPSRKTKYDLIGGYKGDRFINIDSQIPNKVVEEALRAGKIDSLTRFKLIEREKTFGNSRFDFKLSNGEEEYYLEVKGVTLELDGKTMFPDAPTERGRKHLLELVEVIKSGRGAGVLFLIQLEGVEYFTPHDEMDKAFGEALRYAKENGVDIFAYDCQVGEDFINMKDKVKIIL